MAEMTTPQSVLKTSPLKSAWKIAEEYGFDMSLIEESLRRTPMERMRVHDNALKTALMLRRAMEKRLGRG